jgi:hypothetical protein
MAENPFYDQGLEASSDIAVFEPIRPSPLSETVPFFEAGTRSSTWPMFKSGSHDVSSDSIEEGYDNGADQTRYAELEASDSGTIKPCECDQVTNFQLLTRPSDL